VQIAYQGEPGAYSEAASLKWCPDAEPIACPAFEDVFASVERGDVACGTLPIENSIGGTIHRNYDLLVAHEALHIVGEVELPVSHALVALPGTDIGRITQVYSHPQALAQCDGFLRTLRGIDVIATYDTAGSAKLIAERRLEGAAAIASARAAELFGLSILRSAIQDFTDNITRFLIVRRLDADAAPATDADKTTIVFSLPNEAGALFKALSVFALRDIGLTKLESRPIPGKPWEYLFYADLDAGAHASPCARAVSHLAEFALSLRTLGSYRQCAHPTPSEPPSR
jgi:prephenate dehydratase